jgi:hypothetical protein
MVATRRRLSVAEILGSVLSSGSRAAPVFAAAVLRFTTDRPAYRAGEQGAVIVRNDGSHIVRLNLCPRQLEQQLGDAWLVRERSPGPGEICTTVSIVLPPGATSGTGFRLPRGLGPGTYRWRFFGIGAPPENAEGLTNIFGVEA